MEKSKIEISNISNPENLIDEFIKIQKDLEHKKEKDINSEGKILYFP